MRTKITFLFLVVAIALVFAIFKKDFFSYQSNQNNSEIEGKEFSKKDILGYLYSQELLSYEEKPLVIDRKLLDSADVINIHFWASWCAPCVNEVPELIEFAKRVSLKNEKNLKVLFLTVSLDEDSEELNKFLKSFPEFNKNPFIRIWDKNKSFSKLVNADRLPMTIILNKNIPEPRVVRGVVEWKSINF